MPPLKNISNGKLFSPPLIEINLTEDDGNLRRINSEADEFSDDEMEVTSSWGFRWKVLDTAVVFCWATQKRCKRVVSLLSGVVSTAIEARACP